MELLLKTAIRPSGIRLFMQVEIAFNAVAPKKRHFSCKPTSAARRRGLLTLRKLHRESSGWTEAVSHRIVNGRLPSHDA